MATPSYGQPAKNEARIRALSHAVRALTRRRKASAILTRSDFESTISYAIDHLRSFRIFNDWIDEVSKEATAWLGFHEAEVGRKAPGDLRVLYLSGPEPQNDLQVLTSLGVLPQHIWAVESERAEYADAVTQLTTTGSFIRIHHGKLDRFFLEVGEHFDIVYMDACGPLPSGKPNTLGPLLALAQHQRLTPLSVLITNFAEPAFDQDTAHIDLMTEYFAPRYNDVPMALHRAGADPAVAHLDPDHLKPYIAQHTAATYSDFVTRFVVDIMRTIAPQRRIFTNGDLRRKYFAPAGDVSAAIREATKLPQLESYTSAEDAIRHIYADTGDVLLNPQGYPVPTFLRRANLRAPLKQLLEPLLGSNISGTPPADALLTIGLLEHIIAGHAKIASPEMIRAIRSSWFDHASGGGALFCDIPYPNLLVNSLFGIYARPSFPNPRQSIRLSYVAKKTRMYLDCLVLDQCRYYFDYLPTIDLIPERFKSEPFQLVLRACLDRIGRYDWSSSSHPFSAAALAGFGEIPIAKAYDFAARVAVRSKVS